MFSITSGRHMEGSGFGLKGPEVSVLWLLIPKIASK